MDPLSVLPSSALSPLRSEDESLLLQRVYVSFGQPRQGWRIHEEVHFITRNSWIMDLEEVRELTTMPKGQAPEDDILRARTVRLQKSNKLAYHITAEEGNHCDGLATYF
jgi:hypothetical protein